MTDLITSYEVNPESEISSEYQMQLHDGLYIDYDYSKSYVTASYHNMHFECIDILYETIDPNYIGDCLGINPNGILQQQTYANSLDALNSWSNNVHLASGTVTYTLENEKSTYNNGKDYYEFDIYIESSQNGYLSGAAAVITYNPLAFGNYIISNNKLTVTRGKALASVVDYFSPSFGDDNSSKISGIFPWNGIFSSNTGPFNLFYLTANQPVQLVHIKMEIQDCTKNPDLSFEYDADTTMLDRSYYTSTADGSGNHFRWDNIVSIDDSNSPLCQMNITSIIPIAVNGGSGTGNTFNIQGNYFGSAKGTVEMRNAEDGGTTWVKLDDMDIIWGTNNITVNTPSEVAGSETPGSGKVRVTDVNNNSVVSNDSITVGYSWKNDKILNTQGNLVFKRPVFLSGVDLVINEDLQTQDLGYKFIPNSNIITDTAALACVQEAIDRWVCATEIRFELGNTPQNLSVTQDNKSLIRFGTTANSAVLGETKTWAKGCQNGNNTVAYITDVDVVIQENPTVPFFYDETGQLPQPANSYDFFAIILHELGHAGLLNHVNDKEDIMYYKSKFDQFDSIPATNRFLPFSLPNLEGGELIVEQSSKANFSICTTGVKKIVPLEKSNCVTSLRENDLVKILDGFVVYPNPTTNNLTVKFSSQLSQKLTFEIYDFSGKLVLKDKSKSAIKGTNSYSFNVGFLPDGIYFIRLYSNVGSFQSLKFIKQ